MPSGAIRLRRPAGSRACSGRAHRGLSGHSSWHSRSAGTASHHARHAPLPQFEGFRTIERLASGGMGEVYKLQDTQARIASLPRRSCDRSSGRWRRDFLKEARTLALFSDRASSRSTSSGPDQCRRCSSWSTWMGSSWAHWAIARVSGSEPASSRRSPKRSHHAHALGLLPSRSQARQHHARCAVAPEDPGLRPQRRRPVTRALPRHAPLPRTRAARSLAADRRAHRRLCAWASCCTSCSAGPRPYERRDEAQLAGGPSAPARRLPVEIEAARAGAAAGHCAQGHGAAPGAIATSRPARWRSIWIATSRAGPCSLGRQPMRRRSAPACGRTSSRSAEWERLRLIYPHEAATLRGTYRRLEAGRTTGSSKAARSPTRRSRCTLGAFLADVRQPVLLRRAPFLRRRRGLARPFAVLATAVHRPQPRRRSSCPPGPQGRVGGVLPRWRQPVAAVPAHRVPRDGSCWVVPAGTPGQFFDGRLRLEPQLQLTDARAARRLAAWLALRTRTMALSTA